MVQSYSIPKATRDQNKYSNGPGPGSYVSTSPGSPTKTGWSMGTGKRLDLKSSPLSPGPGAYKVTSSLRESGFSMGLRTDHSVSQGKIYSPGPGQYNPRLFNKTFAYSMGSKEPKKDHMLSPGPGAYDQRGVIEESKRGPRFGSSARANALPHEAPGPGAYN